MLANLFSICVIVSSVRFFSLILDCLPAGAKSSHRRSFVHVLSCLLGPKPVAHYSSHATYCHFAMPSESSISRLNESNYYKWKMLMEALLVQRGLLEYVDGSKPKPTGSPNSKPVKDFMKRLAEAHAEIVLHVETLQLTHVRKLLKPSIVPVVLLRASCCATNFSCSASPMRNLFRLGLLKCTALHSSCKKLVWMSLMKISSCPSPLASCRPMNHSLFPSTPLHLTSSHLIMSSHTSWMKKLDSCMDVTQLLTQQISQCSLLRLSAKVEHLSWILLVFIVERRVIIRVVAPRPTLVQVLHLKVLAMHSSWTMCAFARREVLEIEPWRSKHTSTCIPHKASSI